MFKTALKLIFRNWWRNKTFTLISILSLTVGIACTALLISFVSYEYGIEKDNPNRDKLVWVMQDMPSNPGEKVAYMRNGIPEQLKEKYPEVEDFLQLNSFSIKNIGVNGQKLDPIDVLNVNASFPYFFPFELLYGSWDTFNNPQSIIISEKQATRLFGNQNALGKQLTLTEQGFNNTVEKQYTVGAVAKNRTQSAVLFDGLICDPANNWGGPTLLMMAKNTDIERFEEKVKKDGIPTLAGGQYFFISFDKSISSTYNRQELNYWHYRKDSLLLVGLISAILVFLIAIFNYVNMSFSRVLQQVKSIQTQKMMGAPPREIRMQLFGDTFLMVFISFLLSLLLMFDILPVFNRIVSADFSSSFFYSGSFFPFFILFILFMTVIPALFISRKISQLSLSDYRLFFAKKKNYRIGALVTLQFVIAIALISGMITANRQMNLVEQSGNRYKNLVEIGGLINKTNLVQFKQKVVTVSGVSDVSLGNMALMNAWIMHGDLRRENGETFQTMVLLLSGDASLFRLLQLRQIAGNTWETLFEKSIPGVFVNKTFADLLGKSPESLLGEPLQKYLNTKDSLSIIAGVADDFYFNSLEEKTNAVVMEPLFSSTENYSSMQIRLNGKNNPETLKAIKSRWEQTYPDIYFTYTDVYDSFMKRNGKIAEMSRLLKMYSLISILLTCFGLFGITFYAVRQRTKEIGIRKINGAHTPQLLWLLIKPMFVWIIIGFAVAAPLAWWLMEKWLQQFVYRVDISVVSFILALLFVMAITFLTVGWHVWRTAKANPVESLKSE